MDTVLIVALLFLLFLVVVFVIAPERRARSERRVKPSNPQDKSGASDQKKTGRGLDKD